MTAHEVLAAQKRSAEVALAEARIGTEVDLKRLRLENHSLVSEKAELNTHVKTLERRLEELTESNDMLKQQLHEVKSEAQERIARILNTYKHDEELAEVHFYFV